jgi:HD-GYP domain-containing protein (c-di-GMP phosphodiesterase class II)
MSIFARTEGSSQTIFKLHEAVRALYMARSVTELLSALSEQAKIIAGASQARVFLYDDRWKELYAPAAAGKEEMRFRIDNGIAGWVVRHGGPWRGTDLRHDKHFLKEIDGIDGGIPRNAVFVPIAAEGEPIVGVLEAFDRGQGAFTEEDETVLSLLAEHAALASGLMEQVEGARHLALGLARRLGEAVDAKHPLTVGHTERVRQYATSLARAAGLTDSQVRAVSMAASLHNIGRLEMSPRNAKGELISAQDIEDFRTHLFFADAIVKGVPWPEDLKEVPQIIMKHTEHLDGTGYPRGITAEEIPTGARILGIANFFDRVTSGRHEDGAHSDPEFAAGLLRQYSGTRFDTRLVQVFIEKKCGDIEKRRWPRIDYTTPVDVVTVRPDGSESEPVETDAVDISEGGILFKSREAVEPFTLLRLLIHLPTEKVEAMARVARVLVQQDGTHHIGAHFVWVGGKE